MRKTKKILSALIIFLTASFCFADYIDDMISRAEADHNNAADIIRHATGRDKGTEGNQPTITITHTFGEDGSCEETITVTGGTEETAAAARAYYEDAIKGKQKELDAIKDDVSEISDAVSDEKEIGEGDVDSEEWASDADELLEETQEEADSLTDETGEMESENADAELTENSEKAGDPVCIGTGEYSLDDSDVKNVNRYYSSFNKMTGYFGYGWFSNLDEMILVGIDYYSDDPSKVYDEKCVQILLKNLNEYKKQIETKFNITNYKDGEKELSDAIKKRTQYKNELEAKKSEAEIIESFCANYGWYSVTNNADKLEAEIQSLIDRCSSEISVLENQLEKYRVCL